MNFEGINNIKRNDAIKRNNSIDFKKLSNYERIHQTKFINEENKKRNRNHSFDFQLSKIISLKCLEENCPTPQNFMDVYTPIVRKFYPLIYNQENKIIQKNCELHNKTISLFCFTCNTHFCSKCKSKHMKHSFQDLEDIKINKNDLIEEEKTVREKTSLLFEKYFETYKEEKKICGRLKKFKDEIIRFKYFIIQKYKNQKNNFYNIYNLLYIFKINENNLESSKKNIFKKFQGFFGFKMLILHLKYFYEKQKYRWLLKNLISYRKENKAIDDEIKIRKAKYKFNDLDILLKDLGFDKKIYDKMKIIINYVKNNRYYLKKNIYNFIINSVDIYKKYNEDTDFERDLNAIIKQINNGFKELVEETVWDCEDLENYKKSNNFSYYKENNENNIIRNFVDNDTDLEFVVNDYDELKAYNYFKIKEYKSKCIRLNISNKFIAQNYNNKYEKKYDISDYNEFPKKDILSYIHNIDKKVVVNEIVYKIEIESKNIIIAFNDYIKIYKNICKKYDEYNDINIKRKIGNDIIKNEIDKIYNKNNIIFKKDYKINIKSHIDREELILINNEDSFLETVIDYKYKTIPNNYDLDYIREIADNNQEQLNINEEPIEFGNYTYKIKIKGGHYNSGRYHSKGCRYNEDEKESETPEERRERIKEEKEKKKRKWEKRKRETPEERKERKERERRERERKEREEIERRERERREREKRERERREREQRESDIRNGYICPYCYSSNIGTWKKGLRVLSAIFSFGITEATVHKRYCYNCDNYFSADYE